MAEDVIFKDTRVPHFNAVMVSDLEFHTKDTGGVVDSPNILFSMAYPLHLYPRSP